jgi:hypothetical protein
VTWALVLLLLAIGGFTVLVAHRTSRPPGPGRLDLAKLLDAGAGALGLLGLAVVATIVLTDRPDQAAKIAVLGLLCYLVYLGAVAVLVRTTVRR